MVLEGPEKPSYVNTVNTVTNESRIKYIVSFRTDHLLKIYNSQWQYLATVGKGTGNGYLSKPQGSVCAEEGILVADSGKNRVCLFDFTGEFVREYLTAVEGIKYAKSLVFRPPLLWVICEKRVVCFKVHDK